MQDHPHGSSKAALSVPLWVSGHGVKVCVPTSNRLLRKKRNKGELHASIIVLMLVSHSILSVIKEWNPQQLQVQQTVAKFNTYVVMKTLKCILQCLQHFMPDRVKFWGGHAPIQYGVTFWRGTCPLWVTPGIHSCLVMQCCILKQRGEDTLAPKMLPTQEFLIWKQWKQVHWELWPLFVVSF